MKKKKKKNKYANTPKWARYGNKAARHTARIRMAKVWFSAYEGTGKHIVHAYRKKFKVDVMTALNDLAEIGALTAEQVQAKRKAEEIRQEQIQRQKEEKELRDFYDRFPDSSDQFYYIVGYTSGGTPYGVTWEKMGLLPYQSLEDIDYEEVEAAAMDLLDEIRIRRKNAIRLTIEGNPPHELGATKFGGEPDTPTDFVWPIFETDTFDDDQIKPRPLAFLAQFNCAELTRLDKDKLLPRTGLLSFFYELRSQRWGFDPEDKGCARVFWFENAESLTTTHFPDALGKDCRLPEITISMSKEKSCPDYDDLRFLMRDAGELSLENYELARLALEISDNDDAHSKLLGWPDIIQGNMTVECELTSRGYYLGGDKNPPPKEARQEAEHTSIEDWQLLFQLDTVTQDNFELMFGDCGRIYFFIRKDDLKARRFDDVRLVLQCY